MGLVSVAELYTQPTEMIANYMMWAGDLGAIYEEFIKNDDEDVAFIAGWHGSKARSRGIHASELSGECRLPVWYSLKGVQREDKQSDASWKKRFRAGHMFHAMIQEDWRRICEKSGGLMAFSKEVRIDPSLQAIAAEYDIHSSCDGVIEFRDKPWGEAVLRVGLEIKSDSAKQFEKRTGPETSHKRQTCVYMKCLDVPLLWTQYINKSNSNISPSKPPYLFTFGHDLWNVIEGETREVIHLATINEQPPKHEGIVCEFCGYAWKCKPEYLNRKTRRDAAKTEREVMRRRQSRVGNGVGMRVPRSPQ